MSSRHRKNFVAAEEPGEIERSYFQAFPCVPEESRLTVEGAFVGPFGLLERLSYIDLISYFSNEVAEELHPLPTTPGINAEEVDMCIGLHIWKDSDSTGWMATGLGKPVKSNRFSVQEWGSWRLAFLLAWLQRAVWSHEDLEQAPRKRRLSRLRKMSESGRGDAEENIDGCNEACLQEDDTAQPELAQQHDAMVIDFPLDPQDSRFTVEGAILSENGKMKTSAYKDEKLMEIFANEPPIEQHPDPKRPGLCQSELQDPNIHAIQHGLKSWSDKKGRGWIASRTRKCGKSETAWISAATLGSWRLALLLARLQIMVWKEHDSMQDDSMIAPVARSPRKKNAKVSPHVKSSRAHDAQRIQDSSGKHNIFLNVKRSLGRDMRSDPSSDKTNASSYATAVRYSQMNSASPRKTRSFRYVKCSPASDVPMIPSSASKRKVSPQVASRPGKKVPPHAKMDPRSQLLQEKRKKQTGPSNLDGIDDVIDEAKIGLQIEHDLRILAEASQALPPALVLPFAEGCKEYSDEDIEHEDIQHASPQHTSTTQRRGTFQQETEERSRDDHATIPGIFATPKYAVWGRGILKTSDNQGVLQRDLNKIRSHPAAPRRGPRLEDEVQAAIEELLVIDDIL